MLRPGHIRLPKDEAAEAARDAAFARKQAWKAQPGNRYTAEELRAMAADFPEFVMVRPRRKRRVMHLN